MESSIPEDLSFLSDIETKQSSKKILWIFHGYEILLNGSLRLKIHRTHFIWPNLLYFLEV